MVDGRFPSLVFHCTQWGFFGVAENFNSNTIISKLYLITLMRLEIVHQIVTKSYNQLAN